jgi:hypothetical protein
MPSVAAAVSDQSQVGHITPQQMLSIVPLLLGMGISVVGARWQGYPSLQVGILDLFARLSPLVFFSLLIERSVEMLVSPWRSDGSYERLSLQQQARQQLEQTDRALAQRLAGQDSSSEGTDQDLREQRRAAAEQFAKTTSERKRFQAMTLRWTFSLGWGLGMVVSAIGVRALSLFIEPSALSGDPVRFSHLWWFNCCDIVFTGALLAGGADPIHKLLDLYRKTVESTSDRATGVR